MTIPEWLRDDWDSDWRPVRDFLLGVFSTVGFSVPGIAWVLIAFDRVQAAVADPSTSMVNPIGIAIYFTPGLMWIIMILAIFGPELIAIYTD